MYSQVKLILLLTGLLINQSFALTCPTDKNAPLCPNSGSTLLDDTFPAKAYVISNSALHASAQSDKVTSQFVTAMAKSYNFENVPQVLIPIESEEAFEKIKTAVKANLVEKKLAPEKINEILSQITQVKSQAYTWQQDYFESFVDLKTGSPVLREFESYTRSMPFLSGTTQKLQNAGHECQIGIGDKLTEDHKNFGKPGEGKSFGNGEMGGNVEGAPAGLCLTGDNQSLKVAEQYCGKKENVIQLQTSWLTVGHVDEIFKIIPSQFNDGRPPQCQFTLMAASPKKGLDLLGKSNFKNNTFYSFSAKLSESELNEAKASRSGPIVNAATGNKIICDYIEEALKNGLLQSPQKDQTTPSTKTVLLKILFDTAYATLIRSGTTFNCAEYIDQVPNEIILNAIQKDQDILHLNMAIQDSIDKDKKLIKSKILERLPECSKYYDEMDVPDLFHGSAPIEKDGHYILPRDKENGGDIDSFMPNPTNSVIMNRSVLLPESGNSVFDSYVEQEFNKRKMEVNKIDTWDYAHVGNGNMHCSSHTIPYCRPR